MKTNRIALLCDIPGLWWAATKYNKGRVDYAKLRQSVQSGNNRQIERCHAWLADREGLEKFETALKHMGYNTTTVGRGTAIDQLIYNAALEAAMDCNIVAIAASSGRYLALRDVLKEAGVELEIWAFPVQCPLDEMNGRADRWSQLGDDVLLAG